MTRLVPFVAVLTLAAAAVTTVSAAAPPSNTYTDPDYDVLLRPTDAGQNAPFDPAQHRPPNLLSIVVGSWEPQDATTDVFAGAYSSTGGFARVDVSVAGLQNPPGSTAPTGFDPFRYGADPVYGFVEIDIDDDNDTGGELDAPEFRYLVNAPRFGGLPDGSDFGDRQVTGADQLDADFTTKPYIERHGEEIHIALLGEQFADTDIVEVAGDGDLTFEAGEDWRIDGTWVHRAHGFEQFSLAFGGVVPGEYFPMARARFAHHIATDVTTISFVFPLTNQADAAWLNQPTQPNNSDASDQTSIEEALEDLVLSADLLQMFPSGLPEEVLILGWSSESPSSFLKPRDWRVTALLGMTYTVPGYDFVWTDVLPDVTRGDVNGENGATIDDRSVVGSYISDNDALDGMVDGQVTLGAFAADFRVFDINYDGVVDSFDVSLAAPAGNTDNDEDVDLVDYAAWQRCLGQAGGGLPCAMTDINGDGQTDSTDFAWFDETFTGPLP